MRGRGIGGLPAGMPDVARSRDWYTEHIGLTLEFEVPERKTVALKDDGDLTLFLYEDTKKNAAPRITMTFQVVNVEETHRKLTAQGIEFEKPPQRLFWGYGAELRDADGSLIYLWDPVSMREKGET